MATNTDPTWYTSSITSATVTDPSHTHTTMIPSSGTFYYTNTNYPFPGNSTWPTNNPYYTEWQQQWEPQTEPIPPFADAMTARANLLKQLELLKTFEDGLHDKIGDRLSDAIFFLQESIKQLDELIGDN